MIKDPTISVVIPLYNKRPHIERTLASVRAQTAAPLEVIVVDDGSTDGSYEAAAAFDLKGLQVLRRSPPGPAGSAARNLGTKVARGDWVALLDADDEWLPSHLANVSKTLARASNPDRVSIVFASHRDAFSGGRIEDDAFAGISAKWPDELDFAGLVKLWLELGNSPIHTSAVVLRRTDLIEAGGFPAERCSRGEDKDTWLRVAHRGLTMPTKRISAVYHRDAVNMATSLPYANTRPCIEHSIGALLADAPEPQRRLLQRLANHEIFKYALATAKVARLRHETWRGYFRDADPLGTAILGLLSWGPAAALVRSAAAIRAALLRRS